MSSVKAQTYNLFFIARVASFYPIKNQKELVREFSEWLAAKGLEKGFLVYNVTMDNDGERHE